MINYCFNQQDTCRTLQKDYSLRLQKTDEKIEIVKEKKIPDKAAFLLAQNRIIDKDNPTLKYIIYDKETKESLTAKDENGMGMTDDILGGPPVWPRWISDDYYMNAVESYELLDKIETGEYTPSPQLQELLSGIDEFANPLVVLCHKKK